MSSVLVRQSAEVYLAYCELAHPYYWTSTCHALAVRTTPSAPTSTRIDSIHLVGQSSILDHASESDKSPARTDILQAGNLRVSLQYWTRKVKADTGRDAQSGGNQRGGRRIWRARRCEKQEDLKHGRQRDFQQFPEELKWQRSRLRRIKRAWASRHCESCVHPRDGDIEARSVLRCLGGLASANDASITSCRYFSSIALAGAAQR